MRVFVLLVLLLLNFLCLWVVVFAGLTVFNLLCVVCDCGVVLCLMIFALILS